MLSFICYANTFSQYECVRSLSYSNKCIDNYFGYSVDIMNSTISGEIDNWIRQYFTSIYNEFDWSVIAYNKDYFLVKHHIQLENVAISMFKER